MLNKNTEALNILLEKYPDFKEEIEADVETALEILKKYKINESEDKWIYELIDKKVEIREDTGGNSIVFKNAAIILKKNKLIDDEIKVVGTAIANLCKGRTLAAFYGHIKRVDAGELYEILSNEFNNFVRKNKYPLTEYKLTLKEKKKNIEYVEKEKNKQIPQEKREKKEKNPFKNLYYSTNHLPYYQEFSSMIGLYGRHYIPILKARWYQLHGGILQKQIKIGNLITDTRLHVAYPIVTEGGKNELIYGIKSLIENVIEKGIVNEDIVNFKLSEPISYSPESLIGKYVERLVDNPDPTKKKPIKVKIENRGHFDNDFLEFDECNNLITSSSPENIQAREYLSKSENPIGKNKVEKRLVDDIPSETLSYFPKCTNSYYFQPFGKIPESAILQGFMRRKIIPVGNVNLFLKSANEGIYANKLTDSTFDRDKYQENIIEHLKIINIKLKNTDFSFTEKARKLLKDYSLYIADQGNIHSEKIINYCKLVKYTTLQNLIKMSCIIAASYYSHEVNENAVSLAFMDLIELMQNTFDFIYERVIGDFDYGAAWKGADYKQTECLKYLFYNNALSRESSEVSIDNFLKEIVMPTYNVKESSARKKYLKMKKEKLIDSDQTGITETKVWLNFNPNMHKSYFKGDKGCKAFSTYNAIFLTQNTYIRLLKPLPPLQPYDNSPSFTKENDKKE